MPIWIKLSFVALYLFDAVGALLSIRLDNRKYYVKTKSRLMPLLLAAYLICLPKELRVLPYQKLAIIGLLFYTAGDVFLLFPKAKTKRYFYIGMASFYLGHLSMSLWFAQSRWTHSIAALIAATAIILFLEFGMFYEFKKTNRKLGIVLVSYSSGLALLAVAIASTKTVPGICGILLFILSDYTIARRELQIKTTGNLFTMATYIAAQTMIVTAMYLMQV